MNRTLITGTLLLALLGSLFPTTLSAAPPPADTPEDVLIDIGSPATGGQAPAVDPKVRELQQRAEQGEPLCQYLFGVRLMSGTSGEKQPQQAFQWFSRAAEQGFAPGQTALGKMYLHGVGARKNYFSAVKWFRQAANQGFAGGQAELGLMYYSGKGVHQDFIEAYALLHAASGSIFLAPAEEFPEARQALTTLETKLTPSDKDWASERERVIHQEALSALMLRQPLPGPKQ